MYIQLRANVCVIVRPLGLGTELKGRLNPVTVHLCKENPLHNISGICVRALYLLLHYQAISLVILNGHASKSSSTTRTYKIVSKYWHA